MLLLSLVPPSVSQEGTLEAGPCPREGVLGVCSQRMVCPTGARGGCREQSGWDGRDGSGGPLDNTERRNLGNELDGFLQTLLAGEWLEKLSEMSWEILCSEEITASTTHPRN